MAQKPTLKPGCFSTKFPSTEWTEIPCSSAPPLPHPLRLGQGAVSTGGGAGNSPIVSVPPSHPITSISGFLAQVSGVTSESDPTGAGRWSLQLNANQFNSPLCGGQAGCSGWQQFIADNPGNVYIQYWLVGHANPCPATPPGFPPGPPGRFSPALRGKRLLHQRQPDSGTPTGARRPAGTSRHGKLLVNLTVIDLRNRQRIPRVRDRRWRSFVHRRELDSSRIQRLRLCRWDDDHVQSGRVDRARRQAGGRERGSRCAGSMVRTDPRPVHHQIGIDRAPSSDLDRVVAFAEL